MQFKLPEGYRLIEHGSTFELVHDVTKTGYRVVARSFKPHEPIPVKYWQNWINEKIKLYEQSLRPGR